MESIICVGQTFSIVMFDSITQVLLSHTINIGCHVMQACNSVLPKIQSLQYCYVYLY